MLTESGTFFFVDRTGSKGGEAIIPVRLIERYGREISEGSHGLFKGGFVLHGNDNQRTRFGRRVVVLEGGFVGSVVGLNENLLEWQIGTNESVNPVFVLQHDVSSRLEAQGVLPPRAGLQ